MSFAQVDPNWPVSPAVQQPASVPFLAVPIQDSAGNIVGWYADNGDGTTTTWDANGDNPTTTGAVPAVSATGAVSLGLAPLHGQSVPLASVKGQALTASGPVPAYQAGNALSVLFFSAPGLGAFITTVPAGQQIGTIQDVIQMADGSVWWYLYVGNSWGYASLNPLQSPYVYVPVDPALVYSGGTPMGALAGAAAGVTSGILGGVQQALSNVFAGTSTTMLLLVGGVLLLVFLGPELAVSGASVGAARARRRPRRRNPPRIVYNRLLGGWFIVHGPHQTPIGGPHPSKAAAQLWLRERAPSRNPEEWRLCS